MRSEVIRFVGNTARRIGGSRRRIAAIDKPHNGTAGMRVKLTGWTKER